MERDQPWECRACTLINECHAKRCTVCLSKRPIVTVSSQQQQPSMETLRRRSFKVKSVDQKDHNRTRKVDTTLTEKKSKLDVKQGTLKKYLSASNKAEIEVITNSNYESKRKSVTLYEEHRNDGINEVKAKETKKLRGFSDRKMSEMVVKSNVQSEISTRRPLKRQRGDPTPLTLDNDTVHPIKPYTEISDSVFQNRWNESQVILRQVFRIETLRNLQPQAIKGVLRNNNQIIVMATGGGKSLCYQLPAGVTFVISPLIALMVDQVTALKAKGVSCALLSSANNDAEKKDILKSLENLARMGTLNLVGSASAMNPLKLVYCTPEMVETIRFKNVLKMLYLKRKISLFAIDEAHCLSCWGHTFRPAYLKLSWLRAAFPDVPCMACTATATKKVIEDIRKCLCFDENTNCLISSFNRKNIMYEVRYKEYLNHIEPDGALGNLITFVKSQHTSKMPSPCAGIVYVHKRTDAASIALQITKRSGIKAAAYHAGLNDKERNITQDSWTKGEIQVVVATVAFGMGIDLGHVRYVIHWCLSKSIEGFYQESGRAGRDGLLSKSILYFSHDDASKLSFIARKNLETKPLKTKSLDNTLNSLEEMIAYCSSCSCRRKFLLQHFGEEINTDICNKTCDFCLDPAKIESTLQAITALPNMTKSIGRKSRKTEGVWDGQWNGPAGDFSDCDYEFSEETFVDENALSIYGKQPSEIYKIESSDKTKRNANTSKGRLSEKLLHKYEAHELGANGFVKFKQKEARRCVAPTIPDHLRKGLPDPYAMKSKSKDNFENNSTSIDSQIVALQAKIKALQQKSSPSER